MNPYFGIQVVDATTGRGVPLVELRTTSELRFLTDSAGWVAFHEPGLMDTKVWFSIKSHGYAYPKDGFGYAGVALTPKVGATATIKLPRTNLAERLYRVTGEGIYRDSLLLGKPTPPGVGQLNGRVMGQDSVLVALYKNRLHWFWGDTARPDYPLGHFGTAGATSSPKDNPDIALKLSYFVDAKTGFSRPMFPQPKGPGPIWITGLAVVDQGESLVCFYSRMKDLGTCVERGLAVFNEAKACFEPVAEFDPKLPEPLSGHPFLHEGWLYGSYDGGAPLPCVRVRPTLAALKDLTHYERVAEPKLSLTDAKTGEAVQNHGGSIYWSVYRQCWVMILLQKLGKTSNVGEVWYAEAKTLLGPWEKAVQIVTHDKMDFYNVTQHPYFDRGRFLYFEGTYVNTFSGNPDPTPRYNYNQILYRLDLDVVSSGLKPTR
jgi:hypothetical protein